MVSAEASPPPAVAPLPIPVHNPRPSILARSAMRFRAVLARLLLAFALVLSQHGAAMHALGHLAGTEEQEHKGSPHDRACVQCVAFAEMGSGIAASAPVVAVAAAGSIAASEPVLPAASRHTLAARARAPPAVL